MHGWSLQRFSDVASRDGFVVELLAPATRVVMAEAFANDEDGSFTLTTFSNVIPVVVMEWFIVEARRSIAHFTDGAALPQQQAEQPPTTKKRASPQTTTIGYRNRNWQIVRRATGLAGTDHLQKVYELECGHCGHVYGANGSDIHLRLCPRCQGGRPGLPTH
jgi:hypothetical protein